MQPGDNFAIAASVGDDATYRNSLSVKMADGSMLINATNQVIPISGEANPNNVQGIRTRMLTVWRRLHIEIDSMGRANENYIRGEVPNGTTIKVGATKTINVTANALEENRFENGRMELAAVTDGMEVVSNTANSVTVKNFTSNDIVLANNVNYELLDQAGTHSAVGTVPSGQTIATGQTVTLTVSCTPMIVNAFSMGQMVITPVLRSVSVISNTANSVTVKNNSSALITIVNNTHFRLYDDDDYNSTEIASTLHGDENELIVKFSDTLRHLSDNLTGGILPDGSPMNILASAYILPEYDWAENVMHYNQSNVDFDTNVEAIETGGLEDIQRGSRNDERDGFWIAYVIVAYQGFVTADADGRINGMLELPEQGVTGQRGVCDCYMSNICPRPVNSCSMIPTGGDLSLIFEESTQDYDRYLGTTLPPSDFTIKVTEIVAPHEIGHQFGLKGDLMGSQFAIMDYPTNDISTVARVQFHPEHINIMRHRVKSPGQ